MVEYTHVECMKAFEGYVFKGEPIQDTIGLVESTVQCLDEVTDPKFRQDVSFARCLTDLEKWLDNDEENVPDNLARRARLWLQETLPAKGG